MKSIITILLLLLGKRGNKNPTPPKQPPTKVLSQWSSVTCPVCLVNNVDITEQGLCENCGNVII